MRLARRRIGDHLIVVDPSTSRRLARFGHVTSGPEIVVRQFLSLEGLRFRITNKDLPGSPDLANRTRSWAVFVHGCFWHHHGGCSRATIPSRNRGFWLAKFRDNRRRDRRVVDELVRAGFTVAIVWECESKHPQQLSRRLRHVLQKGRGR